MALTYRTAGESHGPALLAVIEGLPAGLRLTPDDIDADLARRQLGYGRGGRMKIEKDRVVVKSGLRHGMTLGSPLALEIPNLDFPNWSEDRMAVWDPAAEVPAITLPRPGHADLAGMMKYQTGDLRNILERASARETAARVAAGGVAKALLRRYGMEIRSHVVRIGPVTAEPDAPLTLDDLEDVDESPVRCVDPEASTRMVAAIKAAGQAHDTLGGVFEVIAFDPLPGLGSHVSGTSRLDGRLGQALLGIQAIKGVEIGAGFALGALPGSEAHDEIFYSEERGYFRATNRAGGLEGGMTHGGAPLLVRAVMKPISTLSRPLASVDISTKQQAAAFKERSDICAVPAAAVVAEAAVAMVLAEALIEKFGGDAISDLDAAVERYRERLA
jgi:chorismate synthase